MNTFDHNEAQLFIKLANAFEHENDYGNIRIVDQVVVGEVRKGYTLIQLQRENSPLPLHDYQRLHNGIAWAVDESQIQ